MPIHSLATSKNFDIEWSSGVDSWGVYIFRLTHSSRTTNAYEGMDITEMRVASQFFIARQLIIGLIKELISAKKAMTLLTRVVDNQLMS